MLTRSVPFAELPGFSRLAADYSTNFFKLRSFYQFAPREPESYAAAAEAIRFPAERRAALVQALALQNPSSPALKALAEPETVVVATGQQTGLFTGPAYTLYKALTAAREVKDEKDALRMAIAFEKETLLFFYDLRDAVPAVHRTLVNTIVNEEKAHIVRLASLLQG